MTVVHVRTVTLMLVMDVRDQRTWGLWRVRSPTSSNKMVANIRGRVEIKVKMK